MHDYDNISCEIIWGIMIKHLPVLKVEINSVLSK
ncbi:hypothetical protein ACFLSQ_08705 [Bacteroidota bacterium]